MIERIKKELLICSGTPLRGKPDACIREGKLHRLLEEMKKLDYKSFVNVFEYAKSLNLPQEFQEELKFEYENRGLDIDY